MSARARRIRVAAAYPLEGFATLAAIEDKIARWVLARLADTGEMRNRADWRHQPGGNLTLPKAEIVALARSRRARFHRRPTFSKNAPCPYQ